jgi:hypothetical protein
MDTVRSCYRSQMRLYSDRPDILTWGRWYRCPPGALPAPPSAFTSSQWLKPEAGNPPLGEIYQPRPPYSKLPADPRLTGLHYCGTTAWTEGITYAERPGLPLDITGMPTCCQALPPAPGGPVIGGAGSWDAVAVMGTVCQCQTVANGHWFPN